MALTRSDNGAIRGKFSGLRARRTLMAFWFTLPAFVAFILFKYYPMLQAMYMSLFDYQVLEPPGPFVGLANFVHAFKDPLNAKVWSNNVILFVWGLILGFWVPLIQAMLLDEMRRASSFYRVAYLLPSIIPGVATAAIWKWMYNADWGFFNAVLIRVGLQPVNWLGDPRLAKFSLRLSGLLGGGLGVFIYLAALQNIPRELYEAADMDGAGLWQKFRYVTLPSVMPIVALTFVLALTGAFQVFDEVVIMTGGGPANSTRVIALNIYYYAFERVQFGYAAAMSVLLFLATFILVAIQLRLSRREVQ